MNWDICAYCKKTRDEVILEFSCLDGSICSNCSKLWHKNNPKAMSKEDTKQAIKIISPLGVDKV